MVAAIKNKKEILKEYKKGVPYAELYKKYNVKKSTFYNWLSEEKLTIQKEEQQLKTTKEYLKLECIYKKELRINDILSKAFSLFNIPLKEKLYVAQKLVETYHLKEVARILQLPYSTLYHHMHDRVLITQIDMEDEILKKHILEYFEKSGQRLGIKKMYIKLKANNIVCSEKRISRLMKELNIKSIRTRKKVTKKKDTVISHPSFNKLQQNFTQSAPNLFWCGDVTQININDNRFYICVILDLFSRKAIAYRISSRNDESLTVNTFKSAYEERDNPEGLTFHSDQGVNYTSNQYRNLLHSLKVEQSFSKRGTPYDNAVIEGFFSNMKQDDLNSRNFEYLDDLKKAVADYIEYYNNDRPHNTLNNKTPNEYEEEYYNNLQSNLEDKEKGKY